MKSLLVFCFLFLSVLSVQAQKYSRIRVHLGSKALSDLSQMGVDIEHGIFEPGNNYVSEFSAEDLTILNVNNIKYDVLIDDVIRYFLEENKKSSPQITVPDFSGCSPEVPRLEIPPQWHLGSMGGYLTYAEMLQILDSMALLFPNLITVKKPVSDTLLTIESRPVYVVKISDNPDSNEAGEPEVLYTALHHAREPLSLSQLIMYMYYLLHNYASDPEIKHIVDNTQLYFIPCVNPDGYLYNESTNPGGGGMWRKNRVKNIDSTYGVDLNRNYGTFWGYDNSGSSPTPNSATYRGLAAFSEPETRMVKEFCEQHNFVFALNYHTFGNDVIYPWSYENLLSPDSLEFKAFASWLTEENKYKYGTCYQMLVYTANGGSDDWFYGEQTSKNKIYAMTPECGNAFWMPAAQIASTCRNMLEQNIKITMLAIDAAMVKDASYKALTATSGYLKYDIQRIGMKNTDTFSVKLISLNSALTVPVAAKLYTGMTLLQTRKDSVPYTINPSLITDRNIKFIIQLGKGSFVENDTIEKIFEDSLITVFSDNATSLSGWVNNGNQNWGISTSEFVSPPSSFHDSPFGLYVTKGDYILSTTDSIDLTFTDYAWLEFYAKWEVERGYDYVQVLARDPSTNEQSSLCGLYTTTLSVANKDKPVYDGKQTEWVKEYIDLSGWAGRKIQIMFELKSSNYTRKDGFYIDDIKVLKTMSNMNTGMRRNEDISVKIAPNPSNSFISIVLNSAVPPSGVRYEITDITGRTLYSELSESNAKTIDIHELAKGVYIFCVTVGERKLIEKFVVN